MDSSIPDSKILIASLLSNANFIGNLLIFCLLLAVSIVLMKMMGQRQFDFRGVKINIGYAWLVFSLLTIVHVYYTWLFVQSASDLFHLSDTQANSEAWEKLVREGPLFFRGLLPRLEFVPIMGADGLERRVYGMRPNDPTTWLAHAGAIVLFVSILRLLKARWRVRAGTFMAAILITFGNWQAGGMWVISASELKLDDVKKSFLLERIQPTYDVTPNRQINQDVGLPQKK